VKESKLFLFYHLKAKQGRKGYFLIGLVLNLLLLFSLSLGSFFRPYYQHGNEFMDPNTFSIVTKEERVADTISPSFFQEKREEGESLFASFGLKEEKVSSSFACLIEKDFNTGVFAISDFFHLQNAGYLPESILEAYHQHRLVLLSSSEERKEQFLLEQPTLEQRYAFVYPYSSYKGKINFLPSNRYQNVLIMPIEDCKDYLQPGSAISFYYTYQLNHDLQDKEINRLSALSNEGTYGVVQSQFQTFVHPSKEYNRRYIPIHSIVTISLYLCSAILYVSFFSGLLADYLKTGDNIKDITRRKVFGRKERQFIMIQCLSLPLSLFASERVSLILYVLFMVIFKTIKGFSFFFSPFFLFLFLAEFLIAFFAESIFAHILYRKKGKDKQDD